MREGEISVACICDHLHFSVSVQDGETEVKGETGKNGRKSALGDTE